MGLPSILEKDREGIRKMILIQLEYKPWRILDGFGILIDSSYASWRVWGFVGGFTM